MANKVLSSPEQGYFVQPYEGVSNSLVCHAVGGRSVDGAACPYCDEVLLTVLSLNRNDPRLPLKALPAPMLPLMCCPRCVNTSIQYAFTSAGEILLAARSPRPTIPAASQVQLGEVSPQKMLLHAIPDRVATARELANEGRLDEALEWAGKFDWGRLQHQVGGVPLLVNRSIRNPTCSLCNAIMPFLASALVEVAVGFEAEEHELQLLFSYCGGCANVSVIPDLATDDYS